QGFLAKTSDSQIIPLHTNHKSGIQQMVNITVNNNQVSHAHQIRFMDYDAVDFRRKKNSLYIQLLPSSVPCLPLQVFFLIKILRTAHIKHAAEQVPELHTGF